jgi:hypothetical protein
MTRFTVAVAFAALALTLSSAMVRAEEPAAAAAASAPKQAAPAATEKAAEPAATTAAAGEKYSPPPGFKTKTRKGETIYCRSRAPLGTRIKSEECFTEAQIKEVERAMATSTDDIQQRGRMCTTGFMCTGQGGG